MPLTLPSSGSGSGRVVDAGNLGASYTLDLAGGSVELTGTLTADCVITITGRSAGAVATLILTQDATGSRVLSISDGTAAQSVTIDPTALAVNVIEARCPTTTDIIVTPLGATGPQGAQGPQGPQGPAGPQGPVGSVSDASNATKGIVLVSGGITTPTSPTVRSADDFALKALTADVGPISAQTALQNITGLSLAIAASATEMWLLKLWLLISAANATMDSKIGFTVPAGCLMKWGTLGLGSEISSWGARAPTNTPTLLADATGSVSPATGAGVTGVGLVAVVFGGGTAGNVQAQYAQATSDAGNLSILKGSTLEATRIAA